MTKAVGFLIHQRATHAYSQLFIAARELGLPDEDIDEIFRRMVFNVMARNCDDHTKNFAFMLKQGEDWRLAAGGCRFDNETSLGFSSPLDF